MTWLLLLIPWAIVNILAFPLALFLPMFAEWRYGPLENNNGEGMGWRLPWWLSFWGTPDNPLTGDYGHHQRTLGKSEYWQMVLWLWRNPAIGFHAYVFNATLETIDNLWFIGNPKIQDAPAGKGGWCFVMVGWYWNLVVIIPLGPFCWMVNIGWNLKTFAEGHPITPSARYAATFRPAVFKNN